MDEICNDFDNTAQKLIQQLREKYKTKQLPILDQMKEKFNKDIKNLSRAEVDEILQDRQQTFKNVEDSLYKFVENAVKTYSDEKKKNLETPGFDL